jgi:hypothetical protein
VEDAVGNLRFLGEKKGEVRIIEGIKNVINK